MNYPNTDGFVPLDSQRDQRPKPPPYGRPKQDAPQPPRLLSYADMLQMPEPEWLIQGVLPMRSAVTLYGPSNSFKSFLALDMALSVQTGLEWHGQAVKRGNVLVIATEGANGVGKLRVPAWYESRGIALNDRGGFLLPQEWRLDVPDSLDALLQSMRSHGDFSLVVLDLFAGTTGGNESDLEVSQAAVRAVQTLMRETGVSVLAVQHTGWADSSRARGHSNTWGSWDTRLQAKGDKDSRTVQLTVERHKDSDSVGKWGFQMEESHGSLVPVRDDTVSVSAKAKKLSGGNVVALNALQDAIRDHGERKYGDNWPSCKVVQIEYWKVACERHSLSKSDKADSRLKAFNRARETLQEMNRVYELDGYAWQIEG